MNKIFVNRNKVIEPLENFFEMSIQEIEDKILLSEVDITDEEIINGLKELCYDDGYNLEDDIPDIYIYEPYTKNYFINYINILKDKSLKLIFLLLEIKTNTLYDEIIEKYDLTIDSNGNIFKSDLERILEATKYNIYELFELTKQANNVETYKEYKINLNIIDRKGYKLEDIYPSINLQDYNNYDINPLGYIKLTSKQKKKIREEKKKESLKNLVDTAIDDGRILKLEHDFSNFRNL